MIKIRTDLALENRQMYKENQGGEAPGILMKQRQHGGMRVTEIHVMDQRGSQALEKPPGRYITIEMPPVNEMGGAMKQACADLLARQLRKLLEVGKDSKILIIGLGNHNITPDALGPKTAGRILVTRHRFLLLDQKENGKLTNVSVITPGVMGNTGIESLDLIKGVTRQIGPDAVIAIDALAARSMDRITTTIQLCDTGISPGAGVGNLRRGINRETLGVKVIGIGVPTVISAASIVEDYMGEGVFPDFEELLRQEREVSEDMIVTPGNIDAVIDAFSVILSRGINQAIHPQLTKEELEEYLS